MKGSWDFCSECGKYCPVRGHKCPPAWEIWTQDEYIEDLDLLPPAELNPALHGVAYGHEVEWAAEAFAGTDHWEDEDSREYWLRRRGSTDPGIRVEVTVDFEPSYTARVVR